MVGQTAAAARNLAADSSASTAIPSTNVTVLPERDAITWYQHANQVQGIRRGHGDDFPRSRLLSHCAQRFHCDGQRELLAEKSADKAAAANLALIFQPSKRDEQLAPAWNDRFARDHFAKHDAISSQQHPAGGFHNPRVFGRLARIKQRPASGAVARARMVPSSLPRPAFGINKRANVVETI